MPTTTAFRRLDLETKENIPPLMVSMMAPMRSIQQEMYILSHLSSVLYSDHFRTPFYTESLAYWILTVSII